MGAFSTGRFAKGLLVFVAAFVAAVLAVGAPNARADEYQPTRRLSAESQQPRHESAWIRPALADPSGGQGDIQV